MPQSSASSEVLAQWHYEPELWRDFVQYESGVYRKSIRSARYFIAGTIIGAVVLITLLSVIPLLITKKFDSSIWGPAFGIGVMAAIFLLIGLRLLRLRKEKIAKLKAKNGEVVITLNELKINDLRFEWSYGGPGWRFLDAERKSVAVDALKKIEILELKFVTFIPSRSTPQRDKAEWRMPIEMGKFAEADSIVARLRAAATTSGFARNTLID